MKDVKVGQVIIVETQFCQTSSVIHNLLRVEQIE